MPDPAQPLPGKLVSQIRKAGLPQHGEEPYRPLLVKNRFGEDMMLKSNIPAPSQLSAPKMPSASWGAAAAATVGRVTVEVDEALETPEWQLSIDVPAFYLRLKIDGPRIIAGLHEFLTAHPSGAAREFRLGLHGSQGVEVLRDDEPGNRFFIVVGPGEKSSLRLTLGDEECRQWVEALDDISDQLRT